MDIYLIDNKTNKVITIFTNVISWSRSYVVYLDGPNKAKIYCDIENEYFTDTNPEED